ncbi:40S ribosomal protein S13 [Tanacetum coccineum]|uniref:40S ribosomal protein S13 n=1 Tax=Tanacetum coccineum TaxID=301880 RepID=A0ABQ5IVQ0_9ASTR
MIFHGIAKVALAPCGVGLSCESDRPSVAKAEVDVLLEITHKMQTDLDVENKRSVLSISGGTFTTPDWLPDGWTVVVLAKATGQKYKVFKETRKKFYSKPQVLNYLGIADNSNSNKRIPLEIPKSLYDLIQKVAELTEFPKLNPNNRFAKRKLKYYKLCIHAAVAYHLAVDELPRGWKYNPETFFMAHVPKPPTPPKPKTKKKIKITWSSYNYHDTYQLNYNEQNVWNLFRMTYKVETNELEEYPYKEHLHTVDNVMVVDLLGKFAVNTFNKSCQMYIFYMTIEAIEQGIPGVYKTRVECDTGNGAMTLQNFVLKDREPKCM